MEFQAVAGGVAVYFLNRTRARSSPGGPGRSAGRCRGTRAGTGLRLARNSGPLTAEESTCTFSPVSAPGSTARTALPMRTRCCSCAGLAGCGGLAAMAGVPGLPRRRPRPGAWRRSRETVSIQRISSVSALRAWTAQASARTRGSWTRPIGDPWQHPARVRGWRERGAPPAGWLLPLDRTVQPGPFRGHAPAFGIDGAGFQKRQAEHNGRRQSSAALRASWQARSRPSVGSPLAGTRRTANLSARLSVGPPPQPGF